MSKATPPRLRAPGVDGGLLAKPPIDEAGPRLAANRDRLEGWDHDFQGRRADRLRLLARRQVLDQARRYHARYGIELPEILVPGADRAYEDAFPLIVTGHQPELFHPGVWIKNLATASIARHHGGIGLNLIVDNDLPKAASIRVPRLEPERGRNGQAATSGLRTQLVDFDEWSGEVPYEELQVVDETLFGSFGARVREVLGDAVPDPLIDDFWPRAIEARERTNRLGLRFALARRAVEADWGAHNLEVPLSAVCETEGFLWFAAHLLAHLPRFHRIHNEELARYRQVHGLRSKHHPVPALATEGDWLEAPFWVWRQGAPRRRPLLVRQRDARTMELRIKGEDEPLTELPLGPDREACCAVDRLRGLPAGQVRLRTRA